MPVALLEINQSPEDKPIHFVTGAKARKLVYELKIAVPLKTGLIRLTIAKPWLVVKKWIAISEQERRATEAKQSEAEDRARQFQARARFVDGAELGFCNWPAKDQRTQV
jgi:hypothetical protein